MTGFLKYWYAMHTFKSSEIDCLTCKVYVYINYIPMHLRRQLLNSATTTPMSPDPFLHVYREGAGT